MAFCHWISDSRRSDAMGPKARLLRYRKFVYEVGSLPTGKGAAIDAEVVEKEEKRGFELSPTDCFRYRTRYCTRHIHVPRPGASFGRAILQSWRIVTQHIHVPRPGASFGRAILQSWRIVTDSGVIGSKEFVSECYVRFQGHFNCRREKRPTAIRGIDGVYSLKRLRLSA